MLSKPDIRKTMLARRREIPEAERVAACGYLCNKLTSITLPVNSIIGGYVAMQGEVDISQALVDYCGRGFRACLPVVSKPELILQFREWQVGFPLKSGAHGTREPMGGELLAPDVLLVPLVAFDRRGARLGYGGGYYDATMAALKKANPALKTIGIAYTLQEVDRLPVEVHDVRLDMIITEREVITPDPANRVRG